MKIKSSKYKPVIEAIIQEENKKMRRESLKEQTEAIKNQEEELEMCSNLKVKTLV